MISNIHIHKSLNMFNHKLYPFLFLRYLSSDLIGLSCHCGLKDLFNALWALEFAHCIFMESDVHHEAAL